MPAFGSYYSRLALFIAVLLPLVSAAKLRENAPGVSPDSILYYAPAQVPAVIFAVVYIVVGLLLMTNVVSWNDRWALCLPIGSIIQGTGYALRLPLRDSPDSLGLYIAMDLFIVLSPAAYVAFAYATFGHFAEAATNHTNARAKGKNLTLIPARKFATTFVISDVITFLIQAGGGGLQVKQDSAKIGADIFLAGIILQFLSYVIFVLIAIRCHWILTSFSKSTSRPQAYAAVHKLFAAIYISSIFIIIRCAYRTVELAQGFRGYLITREVFFYVLDSLPLIIAITIWVFFYPSSFYPFSKKYDSRSSRPFSPFWDLGSKITPFVPVSSDVEMSSGTPSELEKEMA